MRRPLLTALLAAAVTAAVPAVPHALAARGADTTTTVFRNAGGEPNVTLSPSGRYVLADGLSGFGHDPSTLYRSTDHGRHFTRVHQNVVNVGGGDWDMHFIDEHTVIAADLSLGQGIYVDVSRDAGLHWTQTTVFTDVYDRPWIAGRGKDVYLVAKGFDGIPYLYRSHDLGVTFDRVPLLVYGTGTTPVEAGGTSPTPVEALATNQNAYVDNLTVDPRTGDVYVLYGIDSVEAYPSTPPLGAPNRLYVAHLEGGSMVSHPVYLGAGDNAFYAGFNWLTVDQAGTVYVVGNGRHAGHQSAWLSYSKDRGRTWSRLVDVGTPRVASVYGAIAGGAAGRLSLVYYEGTKADANQKQDWYAVASWITGADTVHPHVLRQRMNAKPVHEADICLDGIACGLPGFGANRNLLDYIDNSVAPDGSVWGVFASDGPATHDTGDADPSVLLVHAHHASLGRGVTGT